MGDYFEILDRVKPTLSQPERETALKAPSATPVVVLENPDSGKTYLSAGLEKASLLKASDFLLDVSGRFVEAEKANDNGAFWTTADLEFGLTSVAGGPLNWLHHERHILGFLRDAQLVTAETAANVGPHIRADARIWAYLWPKETAILERAVEAGQAFFSMECVANEIECVGPNGCGKKMPYADAFNRTEKACIHVRERASYRRFVDPIYQGAGIIVPPTQPGWSNAHIDTIREAAALLSGKGEKLAEAGWTENAAALLLQFVGEGARIQ